MTRGRLAAAAITAAVLATAGGAAFTLANRDEGTTGPAATATPAGATAPVTREDLVDTRIVGGVLTYPGERHVTAGSGGTVTSAPRPGRVLRQGDAFIRIDRRPLVLLYGELPLYRELRQGVGEGPDVRQLEQALKALGYGDGLTVDEEFTWRTAQAVRRWQRHNGLKQTGAVDSAQVTFLPSAVRVARTEVALGDRVRPGLRMLTVTGTTRVVHVDLDVEDRHLVSRGSAVKVELPGGETVRGRVGSIGTVVDEEAAQGPEGSARATVDVEIRLPARHRAGGFDRAPVSVTLESERRKNVLSVPVEALLALRQGGYGVELVEADGTRMITSVRTGAYGGGRVEVSGPGLEEGANVGVPAE